MSVAVIVSGASSPPAPRNDVTLGASAGRLAGLAGALLGWGPGEFWAATPAELAAVVRALCGDDGVAATGDDLARLRALFPD